MPISGEHMGLPISLEEYQADPRRFTGSWIQVDTPEGRTGWEILNTIRSRDAARTLYVEGSREAITWSDYILRTRRFIKTRLVNGQYSLKDNSIVWSPPAPRWGYYNMKDSIAYLHMLGVRQYQWGYNPETVYHRRLRNGVPMDFTCEFEQFHKTQTQETGFPNRLGPYIADEDNIALTPDLAIRTWRNISFLVYQETFVCGIRNGNNLLVDSYFKPLVQDLHGEVTFENSARMLEVFSRNLID